MIFDSGICLITDNVPRLAKFYEKVLQTTSEGDDIHTFILIDGGSLAVYSKSAAISDMGFDFSKFCGTGMFTFGFTVENVDDEYNRLKSSDLNIEFVSVPTTYPWGARSMHFRDPDGNIVCLRKLA